MSALQAARKGQEAAACAILGRNRAANRRGPLPSGGSEERAEVEQYLCQTDATAYLNLPQKTDSDIHT